MDLTARREARERVDWRQVRLLLALNWRVRLNAATRTPMASVLGLLLFLMFGMFAVLGSAYVGIRVAGLAADPRTFDVAGAAVHEVFFAVFFLVVVTPVLGFRGSEFLDVTKLFVYPVGHRTAFAATLIGLMTSGSVLFFSLPVFAAVLGYSIGAGAGASSFAAAFASALLLLIASVALGQFVLLAFLNTLKSRKWRDVSMVLVPLVVGAAYATFNIMSRGRGGVGAAFLDASARWFATWKDWTLPLPSWWAGHAVTGAGPARLLLLAALAALIVWLVRASAVLQERAFFGESGEDPEVASVSGRGPIGRVASRIGGPLGALVEKELAILRREPAVRSILVGQAIYPVLWGGWGVWKLVASSSAEEVGAWVPFGGVAAYPLLLMELGLLMNLLGLEGGGAVHSMLFPVQPRLLLAGKNLAYLLVFGTLNAVVAIVLTVTAAVLTNTVSVANCVVWPLLGALEGYCVVAMGLGVGNVMSVVSPNRIAVRDRRAIRQQVGGREGCLKGLVGLASVFGTLALAAPIAAAFHLPTAIAASGKAGEVPGWVTALTVPVGVAISAGSMLLGAAIGGRLLASRTEDVVSRLAKSDE